MCNSWILAMMTMKYEQVRCSNGKTLFFFNCDNFLYFLYLFYQVVMSKILVLLFYLSEDNRWTQFRDYSKKQSPPTDLSMVFAFANPLLCLFFHLSSVLVDTSFIRLYTSMQKHRLDSFRLLQKDLEHVHSNASLIQNEQKRYPMRVCFTVFVISLTLNWQLSSTIQLTTQNFTIVNDGTDSPDSGPTHLRFSWM